MVNLLPGQLADGLLLEKMLRFLPRWIQLRIKNAAEEDIVKNTQIIMSCISRYSPETRLFVNDFPLFAAAAGAHGVHLGQDDPDVRRVIDSYPGLSIGLSTHSLYQVVQANSLPLEYIGFGPVFSTVTKETGYGCVHDKCLAAVSLSAHPVVGIGGIKKDSIAFLPDQMYYAVISGFDTFLGNK